MNVTELQELNAQETNLSEDKSLIDCNATGKGNRPSYKAYNQNIYPSKKYFATESHGIFYRGSAYLSEGNFPKVSGIHPSKINVWCASVYGEDIKNNVNEARKLLNLSRIEYNKPIGLV